MHRKRELYLNQAEIRDKELRKLEARLFPIERL